MSEAPRFQLGLFGGEEPALPLTAVRVAEEMIAAKPRREVSYERAMRAACFADGTTAPEPWFSDAARSSCAAWCGRPESGACRDALRAHCGTDAVAGGDFSAECACFRSPDHYAGIRAGVLARYTAEGAEGEAALAAYTSGAAWAGFAEGRFGRIAPGERADFLFVDRDPMLATPSDLRQTRVQEVWVGGRKVWQAK